MNKKRLASLLIALILSSTLLAETAKPRPNIIVILIDTLRPDFLGTYGFKGDISPGLDAIAGESIVFKNCFAHAAWTKPSITTLITSLYPDVHRVNVLNRNVLTQPHSDFRTDALPDEAETLAEILKKNNYRTAGFVANPFLSRKFGFNQGFNVYFDDTNEDIPKKPAFSADVLTNRALAWLKTPKNGDPYFLYLHLMDTHGPYEGDEEDYGALEYSPSLGEGRILTSTETEKIDKYLRKGFPWDNPKQRVNLWSWKLSYAAGIRKLDRKLNRFFGDLKSNGYLDNTILIVTSDHGEEFLDHGGWEHGDTIYSEIINVPLIIRLPNGERAGTVSTDLVGLIDITPTLISMVGIRDKFPYMQGQDLSKTVREGKPARTKWIYANASTDKITSRDLRSLQNDSFKLIQDFSGGALSLFDSRNDPRETIDVADKEMNQTKKFSSDLRHHVEKLSKIRPLLKKSITLSPEEVERLRSLGYMQ